MKKAIGWLAAWALFLMGDGVFALGERHGGRRLCRMYNRLMLASVRVQDWADVVGPWGEPGGCEER
ncbi:hypothetical protein [Burkholderia ubonensis]|uniref:hypothetical protein n=1 Tax=Burkholderia ubonensis TaxID=101571 RepID=UPI0012F88860|nr:hypothetical protein [Burkholderia ubonensis]